MRCVRLVQAVATVGLITVGGCSGFPHGNQVLPVESADLPATSTPARASSDVSLWVSSPSVNQILGVSRDGKKTVSVIDTAANSCFAPTGLKSGPKQTLWVACNYDQPIPSCGPSGVACAGEIQAYAAGSSSPAKTYSDYVSIERSKEHNIWTMATPNDVAFDAEGDVFAANATTTHCQEDHGIVLCGSGSGGSYTWWNGRDSNATAHIKIPKVSGEYLNFYYLDVDASGKNLYIDGSQYGFALFQVYDVANPTAASWTVNAITPSTSDTLGGVYVSNAGTVLNIVDESARTISQYALPWVTSETPFNILGPTLQEMGKGQPVSGGFDRSDRHFALGDADGWIDFGDVAANKWSVAGKKRLASGALGAAYVLSDK